MLLPRLCPVMNNKHNSPLPQDVFRRISKNSELRPFTIAFLFRQSILLQSQESDPIALFLRQILEPLILVVLALVKMFVIKGSFRKVSDAVVEKRAISSL